LFALRWNDWDARDPDHLRIDEAFGKSGLDDPKTPRSNSYVYLPAAVQTLLQDWKAWCGDTRPEAFIFPSRRNTPTRYDNFLKRVLKPAAEAVGLEGITHQMLRRSFSTMALDSGASPKDVQGQIAHSDARMSLYYGKVIPASVRQEVNKLVRIPMMSITQSDLMPITQERSDAGPSQCELVIDISQEFWQYSSLFILNFRLPAPIASGFCRANTLGLGGCSAPLVLVGAKVRSP
jgi:hypothetical protein